MGRYRKILVAYDGSEAGKNALKQAIKLVREEEASLGVLSVLPVYEGNIEFIGVKDIENVLGGPTEKLKAEVNALAAAAEGASVAVSVERGKAYERIVETAEEEEYDLIVMGRRGISRSARMLLGSVTSRVIGHSRKDVLVIPRDASLAWNKIVLAVDDSECSVAAVDGAVYFAKQHNGGIQVVSAVDFADEFFAQVPEAREQVLGKARTVLDKVKEITAKEGVAAEMTLREGNPYEVVVEVAEEYDAEAIFMGSHGRKGLKKFIMGSVTEKVIGYAQCPVVVMKDNRG